MAMSDFSLPCQLGDIRSIVEHPQVGVWIVFAQTLPYVSSFLIVHECWVGVRGLYVFRGREGLRGRQGSAGA